MYSEILSRQAEKCGAVEKRDRTPGLRVSGFGVRGSGSGFGFWVSDFGSRISNFGFGLQGAVEKRE